MEFIESTQGQILLMLLLHVTFGVWGAASASRTNLHPAVGFIIGFIAGLTGIAGLIGPALFTQTFAAFIGPQADWHLPGAPYLLSTLMLLVATGIAWRATRAG